MLTSDVKIRVASQLGKTNGGTPDTKRDTIINSARAEYYGHRKWKFNDKTADITFSSGVADFPVDYQPSHDIGKMYSYDGTQKTEYTQVNLDDVDSYDSNYFVYALDIENRQFKSNQDTTPKVSYNALPADKALDGSEDADTEPATNITPIVLLATAGCWLAFFRDDENYDRFYKRYSEVRDRLASEDRRIGAPSKIKNGLQDYNLGFNDVE